MKHTHIFIGLFFCSILSFGQQIKNNTINPKTAKSILAKLKTPSNQEVLVVAHRGAWRYAPENSLQAVQRCIDLGVDVIELDFRLTKDGHLVAMHDTTVNRTTNGKGRVDELTLEEIKSFRLKSACGARGSRQQVPTLKEIMLLAKGKVMVNLDKTEGKWVKESYQVLKETNTIDQAIFKGNDNIQFMRNKYGALMDSIIYMPKLWPENTNVKQYKKDYETSINPFMYEILFDTVDAETFKMIPELKKEGNGFLAIALWDELCAGRTDEKAFLESKDSAWGWLVEHGANAIMTDRPAELLEYLRSKELHE